MVELTIDTTARGRGVGVPAVDFVATLVDGSYHEREPSTLALALAAMAAFR